MDMNTGVTASGNPLAAPYLSRLLTVNYYKAPSIDVNSQLKAVMLDNAQLRQGVRAFKFSGNATATVFKLDIAAKAQGFKPTDVYVAGVLKTEGSTADYTVNSYGLNTYGITFAIAPASGTNNIIIKEVYA